ncbi:MAG: beta-lactamase family protein [Planctomycetes bacterium]|nr:beta-lactamase family protein [Planctomycetota bacterium]
MFDQDSQISSVAAPFKRPSQPETLSPEALRDGIVAIVETHLAKHPHMGDVVPGACVAIGVDRLPVACVASGVLRRNARARVTPDTVFRVCSMTKVVTAAACLRLVDRGVLSLDAPIADLLPSDTLGEAQRDEFDWRAVTLRRILSHTAGLNVHSYDFVDPELRLPSARELIAGITGPWGVLKLVRPPGSEWAYSGGGYTLLRLVIEAATKRDAAAVITEEVLTPAGMSSSGFFLEDSIAGRLASGHNASGEPMEFRPIADLTASGLFSTAPDIARFWRACMPGPYATSDRPMLLSRGLADEMTRDQRENQLGRPWGLGFQIDQHGGSPIFRHAGCRPGWWGHAEGYPPSRVVLVTMCNAEKGDRLLETLIGKVRRFVHRGRCHHIEIRRPG